MFSGFDQSALLASLILTSGLFFFFRWVFVERFSEGVSRNYALIAAVISGVITYGALTSWPLKCCNWKSRVSFCKSKRQRDEAVARSGQIWRPIEACQSNCQSQRMKTMPLCQTPARCLPWLSDRFWISGSSSFLYPKKRNTSISHLCETIVGSNSAARTI